MLYGVDVHDGYQRGLDFGLLARQGYTFAVVKLTEGTGYVRAQADEWIRAAAAAGLITGAYHWLTGADGAEQARWFHKHLAAASGPEGMLVQLDCEDDGYGPQMAAWAAEWNRLTNNHPFMIYTGGWWWPRTGGYNGAQLTPHLWHSHYLTADTDTIPDDPALVAARVPATWWTPGYGGWAKATFLQFTSRGDAGGLGNNVDLDAFDGTREKLLALTTNGATMPITDADAKKIVDTLVARDTIEGPESLETWRAIGRTYTAVVKLAEAVARLEAAVSALPQQIAVAIAALPAATTVDLSSTAIGEIRDAVADLGEGGAAQVRADA